jgi:hypothetical protein
MVDTGYWIDENHIYGPEESGEYWIEDGRIFGRANRASSSSGTAASTVPAHKCPGWWKAA